MKDIEIRKIIIIEFSYEGNILAFNEFAEKKTGYTRNEVVVGLNIFDLITYDNHHKLRKILEDSKNGVDIENFELALNTKSGEIIHILWTISDTDSSKNSFEIAGVDITDRVMREMRLDLLEKEMSSKYGELAAAQEQLIEQYYILEANQKRLEKSEERYRLIAEAADIGIWDWDLGNNEKYYSPKWFENLDVEPGEFKSLDEIWKNMVYPEDLPVVFNEVNNHLDGITDHYEIEYRIRTKDGGCRWIKAIGKTLRDANGKAIRRAGSDIDITELKNYQEKLHHLAYRDSLTNLPNRLMLNEKLSAMICHEADKKCAIFFIDSDNFKLVNDTFGHQFGDQLIIQTGKRLEQLLGKSGMVFRLGGDEYILLTRDITDLNEIEKLADKIIRSFSKPFEVNGSLLNVSISVGICIYPDHGSSADELLKNADIAMYKAKETGKGRFIIFDKAMNEEIIERMNIEKNLQKALDNNEFIIYYQPQIDVQTQSISGFEALVRWKSPEMGIVSPLKFIKIAEESKLIIPLGKLVLYNACTFIKKIHELGYGGYTVSVNISIIQLAQDTFVDMVSKALEDTGLSSEYLELEITESILAESFDEINKKLELLRQKGVRIALDDFGKGYSSLNYLKQLSITTLKIDKSFIDGIYNSEKDETLTGSIIDIGRKMGLSVVAEGVETHEQLEYLKKYSCDKIQGYLFSKPLPEPEALLMLKKGKG